MAECLDDSIDRANEAVARAMKRLRAKIERHVNDLEVIGENDMGVLTHDCAGQYHEAVAALRAFLDRLA